MNSRTRRALVALAATAALSTGTLVSASADDAGSADDTAKAARGYKLYRVDGAVPRWNPCRTIHYKVNARKAHPKGAVKDVKRAIRRVHRASGLKFKYLGRTKTVPKAGNNNYRGRTDLVIAWTTPKKRDVLKRLGGYAGFWATHRGGARYAKVSDGFVLLNSRYRYTYPPGFGKGGTGGSRGLLLMHELGHSVGLDHVSSRKQIMYPHTYHRKPKWGAGDRKGLSKVGRPAGCGGFRLADGDRSNQPSVGQAFGSA